MRHAEVAEGSEASVEWMSCIGINVHISCRQVHGHLVERLEVIILPSETAPKHPEIKPASAPIYPRAWRPAIYPLCF